MSRYPIELDLSGRTALVVGLGAVGRRKAAGLLAAGARVVGVDPSPAVVVPPRIEVRAEPYRAAHLDGASLAFATATPEVNANLATVDTRLLNLALFSANGQWDPLVQLAASALLRAAGAAGLAWMPVSIRIRLRSHWTDSPRTRHNGEPIGNGRWPRVTRT